MMYNNYIQKLSSRFMSRMEEIDPQFNFDIGNEFEVHLASLLEEMLPLKFGVCRGFVTPKSGESKGDDIIIYDHHSYPNLRPTSTEKFTIKENIPVDSVYAYIEAKNTIEIANKNANTYIGRAIRQTTAVKSLERPSRLLSERIDGVTLGENMHIQKRKGHPNICNPMYTVIISRGLREKGKAITNPDDIYDKLLNIKYENNFPPDLIIVGNDVVVTPALIEQNKQTIESPFYIPNRSQLTVVKMPNMAFGFGLSMIQWALQSIKLKELDWREVLSEAL